MMEGLKVSDSEVCPRTFLLPVLPALFFPPCNGRVGVLILRPCFRVTLPHKRLETVDTVGIGYYDYHLMTNIGYSDYTGARL